MSLRAVSEALEAEGVNISHAGVAKWEAGNVAALPRRVVVAALCKIFNVEPSWLIEDIYDAARPSSPAMRALDNLDLLTEEEFALLVTIKDQFLTSRRIVKEAV